MHKPKEGFSPTPIQILVVGYLFVTVFGALLLSLPISSTEGTSTPFIDSLFVATSGISTTGLSPVDIGSYFSLLGQIILMCIFQIGGIGYMTVVILTLYSLGGKISLRTRIVARESLATDSYHMLGKFFKKVLFFTFIFESVGAFILTVFWLREYSLVRSIYLGVFHSVSAFCTAGFSTFSNSLMNYKSSVVVNLTIDIVSIAGGIGFFVLADLYNLWMKKRASVSPRRLTVHSKLALLVTVFVMTVGAITIFVSERWSSGTPLSEKVMTSFFQSISASTTDGFNSINIGTMSAASLTILMILMFIGASPGGTGGGVKTTTFGTLCMLVKAYLARGKVILFEREIPLDTILKAFAVFSLFCAIAFTDMLILANIENVSYAQLLFEIISALGNTGLSCGITSSLTSLGKIVLIITMFIGRVGPLTLSAAIIARTDRRLLRYPMEDIFIG